MLLINFFKKASVIPSVIKDRMYLMLFLFPRLRLKFLLLTAISISSIGFSQNLDSLLTVARQTKNDSTKIRMLNKIAFSYIFSDSKKAIKVIKEGKQLAEDAQFNFGLTELTNTHGIYMDVTGKSDSASYYFTKALKLSKTYNFRDIEVMCTNNLGMFNWNKGNFQEALSYFFDALKMNDEFGDEKASAIYLNNIGLIYQEMLLIEKALSYHQKSYDVRLKYKNEKGQATSLNNIGICLKELNRFDDAEKAYKKGLIVSKSSDNLRDYYGILDNLGNLYQLQNKYEEAIDFYMKSLDVPEELVGNQKSELNTFSNLVAIYNKINQPKKALAYAKKGLEIISKYPHYKIDSNELYLHIAESNYMLGKHKIARSYTEQFVQIKDSLFSETNAEAIAGLEVKYETEKKEKQILIQRAELAEQDLMIQKRNYQLFGVGALALILGLIGYLFYNQQKLKNSQLQKENELKDALLKIETQNKLQEQRLRISRDLHDNIGAQLTFIISSIDNLKYAFDIKDEKLNGKLSTISDFTSSTIYELRDTIWAMNKSEITFEDLQSRISNYIDKAHLYDSNIRFAFNVEDSVDITKKFTSVEGMNIHRVVQEAIHNSLKYANPTIIEVAVSKVVSNLILKISDNGKGFDITSVKRGDGLNNMEKRIHSIGGEITINSNKNKGTEVIVTI